MAKLFKRKAYERLRAWKHASQGTSALLVQGARRVGKSTLVEEFAHNEYASHVLIDFTRATDEFKQTFLDTRNDLDSFFLYLEASYHVSLVRRDALVIFDEVQLFPKAREFIKHLVADGRYDYIEIGSLISIRQNVKDILIPSEEETLDLSPMDFEEFLWALGEEPLTRLIRSSFEARQPLPEDLHRKTSRLWREYLLVGGMPQAVRAYATGRDLMAAARQKDLILKLYRDDIDKYGGISAKRIKAVFNAIPGQLSKHEKRLVYTEISNGSRSRDFMTAFAWLQDAGTVDLCTLITDPSVAAALNEDSTVVKCYLLDVGLLASMAFDVSDGMMPKIYRQVLNGELAVKEGMLVENAIAQQLVATGHPLHFYSKSSPLREERMEIDFLLVEPYADAAGKLRIAPVEVKSGRRTSTVSLNKFVIKFAGRIGTQYVLHPRQLRVESNRLFLPLYMGFCL